MEVTLPQMLFARERRVQRQQALLAAFPHPLVSFTMNIAGPEKDSPLIRRGFRAGCRMLESALSQAGVKVLRRELEWLDTGCEGYYAVAGDASAVKSLCAAIEDSCPLGRLFDMDVLTPQGEQLRRDTADADQRRCIVCGAPGRGCASRRVHTVEQLQQATRQILTEHFAGADTDAAAALALRGLLDEVCTTPKPGLVDRANSGSHRDMDIFTFTASAAALAPYLRRCVEIGQQTRALAPAQTFQALRKAGIQAEQAMFAATGGVNTHKGAIFTMGTVCGALGRLWTPEAPCREPAAIARTCGETAAQAMEADFAAMAAAPSPVTVGQRLYREYGLKGIRGEVAAGLPAVLDVGLPALERALAAGKSRNDAAAITLLYLIARVDDTNMIARGGMALAAQAKEDVRKLLDRDPLPEPETIAALDRAFTERSLSPGGCADLLAVTLFFHDWARDGLDS